MSEFQRKLFQNRIRAAEAAMNQFTDAPGTEFPEEDTEEARDNVGSLETSHHPRPAQHPFARKRNSPSPASWDAYFAQNFQLTTPDGTVLNVFYTAPRGSGAPLFICHHGAGSGGLSFALLAKELQDVMQGEIRNDKLHQETAIPGILAYDARGHGLSKSPGEPVDCSLQTLAMDFVFVVNTLKDAQPSDPLWAGDVSGVFFVGHSLGGAVVVNAALSTELRLKPCGVCVFDVVEETAVRALRTMPQYLDRRPKGFDSVEEAIEWHLKSGTIRNAESAAVSVPGILLPGKDGGPYKYKWAADLAATQPYWNGWFENLSSRFLQVKAAKLLILAGTDTLDKNLMIGQMQGKYQLIVFNDSGHFIQEDVPRKTALAVSTEDLRCLLQWKERNRDSNDQLVDFWKRNDRLVGLEKPLFGKMRA